MSWHFYRGRCTIGLNSAHKEQSEVVGEWGSGRGDNGKHGTFLLPSPSHPLSHSLLGPFLTHRLQYAFWRQWQCGDMCSYRIGHGIGNGGGRGHNRRLPDAAGTVQG